MEEHVARMERTEVHLMAGQKHEENRLLEDWNIDGIMILIKLHGKAYT